MKQMRLLAFAALMVAAGTFTSRAQDGHHRRHDYTPTIYTIGADDNTKEYDPKEHRDNTIDDFKETHRRGFQQAHNPQFIFATRNNSFALGRRDLLCRQTRKSPYSQNLHLLQLWLLLHP